MMHVKNLMNRHVVTTTSSVSIPDIWKLIFKKKVHAIPVVDKNKKLIGLVTREDILSKLFPSFEEAISDVENFLESSDVEEKLAKLKKDKVEKIMSRRVVFTHGDTNIMRALSRMIVQKVRQLPVVDDEERVIGMISKADIFKKLLPIPKK